MARWGADSRVYAATFGNDVDTVYTFDHGLGPNAIAQVEDVASGALNPPSVYPNRNPDNTITVTLLAAPGPNALRIVVFG